jgi:electron transfer flavoprotein beta subunit
MKVLVFMEIGFDMRIAPEHDPRSGRVRAERLVREVDPANARALELALSLKTAKRAAEITVIHLGPPESEPWLRQALAQGCDRALRVWDPEVAQLHAAGKAIVLAQAARAAGFHLVFTGARGVVHASGQLGVLMAEHLGTPAVTQVVDASVSDDGRTALFTRDLDGGFREFVEAELPVVATVSGAPAAAGGAAPAGVPVRALLSAHLAAIPVWSLADLGVPFEPIRQVEDKLRFGRPRPIRPRLRPLPAPDSALPAFDRILKLVEGTVERREGRLVQKTAGEIVEEVFQTLKDEGWLDHFRGAPRGSGQTPGSACPGS